VSDQADFANEDVNMSPQTTLAELSVGHLGFGAMRVTGPGIWGPPRDENEVIALLRRVVNRGVTFIDTADSYSETLIAKALYPYPPGLVVATKGGLTRPGADRWVTDCRPEYLRRACLRGSAGPLWGHAAGS
jgi:aryl-alcohol dehydrogenase-like predicted oxidoreductase